MFSEEAASERTEIDGVDLSPFSQPKKRSNTGKTYSRKRLIHWVTKESGQQSRKFVHSMLNSEAEPFDDRSETGL